MLFLKSTFRSLKSKLETLVNMGPVHFIYHKRTTITMISFTLTKLIKYKKNTKFLRSLDKETNILWNTFCFITGYMISKVDEKVMHLIDLPTSFLFTLVTSFGDYSFQKDGLVIVSSFQLVCYALFTRNYGH